MECPNCQFQNTPGIAVAVRCATALNLGEIDIHPPRRGKGLFRPIYWPRLTRLKASIGLLRIPIHWSVRNVFWFLIPGLAQKGQQPRWLGKWLLRGWLLSLLLWVLLAGDSLSMFMYGIALSIHCTSLGLWFNNSLARLNIAARVLVGLGLFVGLHYVVYGAVRYAGTGLVVPVRLEGIRSQGLIQDGDIVLRQGWFFRPASFDRGDLVMYEVGATGGHQYAAAGIGADRIIGKPDDHVVFKDGQLLVNGKPVAASLRPLEPLPGVSLDLRAGPGQYIIIPSLFILQAHGVGQSQINALYAMQSKVPERAIAGKLYWRLRPLSRFGPLE
ncbi:MAG: hypothetical protein WC869_14170 [Phycisphaerae bacterium]|jgi:hypothetical protein